MRNGKKRMTPLKIILLVLLIFVLCCTCYGYILHHVAIGMAVSHLKSKYSERMVFLNTEYDPGLEEPPRYYVRFCPESDRQMECSVTIFQEFWFSPKLYLPNEADPELPCQADSYLVQTLTKEMTPVYQEFCNDPIRAEFGISLGILASYDSLGIKAKIPLHPDMTLDELEKGVRYAVYVDKKSPSVSDLNVLWDLCQWCVSNNYEPVYFWMNYYEEGPSVYFTFDEISHLNDFDEFVEYLVGGDWTIGEYLNP